MYKALDSVEGSTIRRNTTASTAIAIDQPLKLTDNILVACASGDKIEYFAIEAKAAGDATTNPISARKCVRGKVYLADIGNGTMANSFVDTSVDLWATDKTKLNLAVVTNGDAKIVGWDGFNTAQCYVTFPRADF